MKRITGLAAVAVAMGGLLVLAPTAPASAAGVTATSAAGTITVTATGDVQVYFTCVSGVAKVDDAPASPSIACSDVTSVHVNGDGGNQIVSLNTLNGTFPSLLSTVTSTTGGSDIVYGSQSFDSIDTGSGDDAVRIDTATVEDPQIHFGTGTNDLLYVDGSAANDTITLTQLGSNQSVYTKVGSNAQVSHGFIGADGVIVRGLAGNDKIDASGLDATTTLAYVSMDGGAGDDTLLGGYPQTNFSSGTGTNTMVGGPSADYAFTNSDTDTIDLKGGANRIADQEGLRSGGRTVTNSAGNQDSYDVELGGGDAVWRARPTGATTARAVASLTRTGVQDLPSTVSQFGAYFEGVGEAPDRSLADIVAGSKDTFINGGSRYETLADITIPTGSWTTAGTIGNGSGSINPSDPSLGTITLYNAGTVSIHGKWTNKDRGFVHRSTRDLMFRFASTATLDEGQALLGNGSVTRKQYTASLMGTDEYRGLDVDRTFVKYLRRKADSGGRTYWINSIRNGKALWRFRAQLFGSNEYFTKAGGTNAAYVVKAYNDVLGRDPDPSGKTYWTNKLNNGADRGAVALQFINSPEARRRLVDDQFLRFLGRKPTTGEQTTWVDKLPDTTGEQDLIANLVNSNEYYNLA